MVISGRLPIWAYVTLSHVFGHARLGVATFDPRLGAGVMVATHSPRVPSAGTLVPVDAGTRIAVEF